MFLIRNCVRKPKKMVPMLYDEDFGFKLAFFDDPGKWLFLEKRQNWKIQRCAFILAMHEWKSTNHASYMTSNECPSIWEQSGLSSSICSEMKAQQTQQKSWNNLKEIGKNYKVRHLLISWQFMPKNWKVILCSCSQIITHQFRTNHDLQAQFI